jgi:lysophospholipase L1-like esterase
LGVRLESFRLDEEAAPSLRIMGRAKRRGFYRPSDLLGYEHEPNVPMRTNRYGMMGPERKAYPLAKAPGVCRVLLLGDSLAEPSWAAESLEAALKAVPSPRWKGFEVWNGGTSSYDIRRYSIYLRHRGLRFQPDLVVNFLSMNDFGIDTNTYYLDKDGFMGYHFPLESLRRRGFVPDSRLLRRSALYRFLLMKAEAWASAREGELAGTLQETGRRYVRDILAAAKENSLPVVFVVFPYLDPPEKLDERQRLEYATITGVLSESGAAWLDLSPLFAGMRRQGAGMRWHPKDSVHPSQKAYADVSREIADFLRRRRAL